VTADDGIGQIQIFNDRLELAAILLGDLRPKMMVILFGCPMVRLASSSRSHLVQRGTMSHSVVLVRYADHMVLLARTESEARQGGSASKASLRLCDWW
jgi:hypothetical protein